jgi:magnesium transporter
MRNIIEYNNLKWIDVVSPTEEDINYLDKEFDLHSVSLRNFIPSVIHPDFEVFDNYISMILHYPRNEESGDVKIHELDIIVAKNYIITSHYVPINPLASMWEESVSSEKIKETYMQKGSGELLFYMLNKFLKRVLEKTDDIGEEVEKIEKEIFSGDEEEMIKKISHLKRKIISFWRAIDPQKEIFNSLKATGSIFCGRDCQYRFSNLSRIDQRINNSLKTYKEAIESLEQTSHSMINLKRNDIMKLLTVFSVVLMPLTLLASIWGMNTNYLPFNHSPSDFWIITIIMVIVLISMIFYFKFKKWL